MIVRRRNHLNVLTTLFLLFISLTCIPPVGGNFGAFKSAYVKNKEAHPFYVGKTFQPKKAGKLPLPSVDGEKDNTQLSDIPISDISKPPDPIKWNWHQAAMVLAFVFVIFQVGYAIYVWSFGDESKRAEKSKGKYYHALKRLASKIKTLPVYKPSAQRRPSHPAIIYMGLFIGYVGISSLATMWIALLPAWEGEAHLGWTKDLSGFLVTLTMTAFVVGEFSLGSSLPRMFGGHKSVLATMLILLCCGMLLVVSQRPFVISVIVTLIAMLYGSVFVLFSHVGKKVLPPSEFQRVLMLLGVATEFGDSFTSLTFSYLLKFLPWQLGVVVVCSFSFIAFFIYWAFVPHVERHDDLITREEQIAFVTGLDEEEEFGVGKGGLSPVEEEDHAHASNKPFLQIWAEIVRDRDSLLVLLALIGAHVTEVYPVVLPAIVADRFEASPSQAGIAKSFYCWGAMCMLITSAAASSLPESQARKINFGMVASGVFGFGYMAIIASTLFEVNICNFLAGGGSAVGMFVPFVHFRDDPNTSVKIAMAGTTAAVCAMLVGAFVGWGHAHLTALSEWELACGLCASSMVVALGVMVLQFPSVGFVPQRGISRGRSSFFGMEMDDTL